MKEERGKEQWRAAWREGGKVKRGEMGNMPVDIIKVGCGAV